MTKEFEDEIINDIVDWVFQDIQVSNIILRKNFNEISSDPYVRKAIQLTEKKVKHG